MDISKCNKTGLVLQKLEQLGVRALLSHGWFQVIFKRLVNFFNYLFHIFIQSYPQLKSREIRPHWLCKDYKPEYTKDGQMILQHGISRTNCVDCLDRTNVAQFGIGFLYNSTYNHEAILFR